VPVLWRLKLGGLLMLATLLGLYPLSIRPEYTGILSQLSPDPVWPGLFM